VSFRILKIGTLDIPVRSVLDADQTYAPIGGETILRTLNGSSIRQESWKKLRTTITGSGWLPAGLSVIDTTVPNFVACIAPQSLSSANGTFTLPTARRSDPGHEPWAFALMVDGAIRSSHLTLIGDVATVTAVADAVGYIVHYFPLLQCWVNRPVQSFSQASATHSWEIIAEEV